MNFDTFFNEQLDHLKSDGNYRYFAELERKAGKFPHASNQVESEKHDVTVCCSNNYLGMGQNPLTIAAMCEAVQRMGTGAGDTRNISGTNHDHLLLKAELADLHGNDVALLFTSNWAVLSRLGSRLQDCVILSDAGNHASMIEGTLGNAYGVVGGYITGSAPLCDFMRSFASGFIFTSALPPAVAAAARASIMHLKTSTGERTRHQVQVAKLGARPD